MKPITRQLNVDIWDDTKIRPGSKWRQEIADALDSSDVAILIVSADFLASDFISTNELPPLLKSAEDAGTLILPIIAAPSLVSYHHELAQFQAINDPSKPLISLPLSEQEAIFLRVAEAVFKHSAEVEKKNKASSTGAPSVVSDLRRESFLEHQTWTRLVKVGDWVYDQEAKRIVGGGVHTYLISRSEYGGTPFSVDATLTFSGFLQHLRQGSQQMNAGIVFGWNADAENQKYYNILITGERILLERIGFSGGDAYRDFQHMADGNNFRIEENREYRLNISFSQKSVDVFSDQQFLCSFSRPNDIVGRVGLRPWRSQVLCTRFMVSEMNTPNQPLHPILGGGALRRPLAG